MDDFRLDESAVRRLLERASTLALGCEAVDAVLSRAASGTHLDAEDIAVLWYAREVASDVVFMDKGEIIEEAPPETFFSQPRNERTRLFLSQVLGH